MSRDEHGVSPEQQEAFRRDGYVRLPGLIEEHDLAELEAIYQRFLAGDIEVPGRDFCDMAAGYDRTVEEFDVMNVMLPRRYHPAWRGNAYELAAGRAAQALIPEACVLDYDQLVAKPPQRPAAVFHWHQDLAYWPKTPDPRTVTVWLALDDADEENGCLRFVAGSQREAQLRVHRPLLGDREDSHTLVAQVDEARDEVTPVSIRRGDAIAFRERVLHGSGGNTSARWRRAYVLAFRTRETVDAERAMGFTHSHEDDLDVLRRIVR